MNTPSNIKIQNTGAEEIGNAEVRPPASDPRPHLVPGGSTIMG